MELMQESIDEFFTYMDYWISILMDLHIHDIQGYVFMCKLNSWLSSNLQLVYLNLDSTSYKNNLVYVRFYKQ